MHQICFYSRFVVCQICSFSFFQGYIPELSFLKTSETLVNFYFHMLINKQRRSLRGCIQDLHIDNKTMSGEENILQGFKNHFANLAVPSTINTPFIISATIPDSNIAKIIE
jgi:hypothetical protein